MTIRIDLKIPTQALRINKRHHHHHQNSSKQQIQRQPRHYQSYLDHHYPQSIALSSSTRTFCQSFATAASMSGPRFDEAVKGELRVFTVLVAPRTGLPDEPAVFDLTAFLLSLEAAALPSRCAFAALAADADDGDDGVGVTLRNRSIFGMPLREVLCLE